MVTLTQLEYIIALDTHRHFVTASEKCFVTQPTLSMQIKKLETDLGVNIFDRSKQPIIPTAIGKKIIEQAKITLSESNKIEHLVKEYSNSASGELIIGIIPSLAPYILPLFIGRFTRKYPDIQVKIIELFSVDIIEQLNKDLIDVGILVTPLFEKGIMEEILFYEEMLLYTNISHPFARQKNIDAKDLASHDLWLLDDGHCFRSQVVNLCGFQSSLKEQHRFEYESGSLETIKKLVEIEGGFTLIPELAVDEQTNPKAVVKKFNSITPLREISFAYTRNYAKKRLLNLLAEDIRASVPEKMKDKERGFIVNWR